MTKSYELPNERIVIADVDESTRTCVVSVSVLDSLISDLNNYADKLSHLKDRPCSACEFKKENGCCKWDCVFD